MTYAEFSDLCTSFLDFYEQQLGKYKKETLPALGLISRSGALRTIPIVEGADGEVVVSRTRRYELARAVALEASAVGLLTAFREGLDGSSATAVACHHELLGARRGSRWVLPLFEGAPCGSWRDCGVSHLGDCEVAAVLWDEGGRLRAEGLS